jgi:hypothetical protein
MSSALMKSLGGVFRTWRNFAAAIRVARIGALEPLELGRVRVAGNGPNIRAGDLSAGCRHLGDECVNGGALGCSAPVLARSGAVGINGHGLNRDRPHSGNGALPRCLLRAGLFAWALIIRTSRIVRVVTDILRLQLPQIDVQVRLWELWRGNQLRVRSKERARCLQELGKLRYSTQVPIRLLICGLLYQTDFTRHWPPLSAYFCSLASEPERASRRRTLQVIFPRTVWSLLQGHRKRTARSRSAVVLLASLASLWVLGRVLAASVLGSSFWVLLLLSEWLTY